jgi:pyruvate, water dikinase
MTTAPFVVWFSDIDLHETSNISKTGKHFGNLVQAGFPLVPGFVITTDAYFTFLKQNHLDGKIRNLLTTVNYDHPESFHQVMQHIKKTVDDAPLPDELFEQLSEFYYDLDGYPLHLRAHTTNQDHKILSQKVSDFEELVEWIKASWVEHFEPNVHWKRHEHKHNHLDAGVEIIVQVDVQPSKKGKIYTIDPHEHTKNVLYITHEHPHASDKYILSKKTAMIIDRDLTHHGNAPKLDYDELLIIADLGKDMEAHLYFPQEITWGMIGDSFYILHTRPITTLPKEKPERKKKLAHTRGHAITPAIGSGIVHIILEDKDLAKVTTHDIVVIETIHKSHIKHLKKARGVIAEKGERHSEVSVLMRQIGIPTLYGVKNATKRFKNGHVITIHGGKSEVYIGGLH